LQQRIVSGKNVEGKTCGKKKKRENKSLTGNIILIDHPVYKNNVQTSESIPIKNPDA